MKRTMLRVALGLLTLASVSAAAAAADKAAVDWTAGMKEGAAEFKSMGPLAFGPDGILFIADAKSAAIVAVDTGDTAVAVAGEPVLAAEAAANPLKVEGIDQKVAALLGTKADEILINDLAVNPLTHNVYLAVSRGRGPDAVPVLLRVKAGGGDPEAVALDKVKFIRAALPDAPVDGVVD